MLQNVHLWTKQGWFITYCDVVTPCVVVISSDRGLFLMVYAHSDIGGLYDDDEERHVRWLYS